MRTDLGIKHEGKEIMKEAHHSTSHLSKQKVRNFLFKWIFPIYQHEIIKILPLIFMMLAALYVYTIYRDIKDAIVFGEEGQSLITVQWCKVFVMVVALPVATLFMKLANIVSRDFIFYQVKQSFENRFCTFADNEIL